MFNTVPIGYPITKGPVNLQAFWGLGNKAWTSNYGQSTQYNIYPDGYSPLTYALAQGFGSPNHISQWNPMLIGFNLGNNTTDPALTAIGQASAYNWGASLMQQATLQSAVTSSLRSLNGIEAQISNILKSDKLDDSQKARLEAVLEEVKRLKEEFQQVKIGVTSAEHILELQEQVKDLIKSASETAKEIMDEIKENEESEASESSDDADETDDETSSSSAAASTTAAQRAKAENEAVDICKNIYDGAIGCVGTDYDKIRAGVDAITKDNVTAVLNMWQEQYQPQSGDENMIETIFDEEMFWNNSTNTGLITTIVQKLEERAKELGVRNSLAGQFAVAYDELDDTFVNVGKVKAAVMTILEKVTEAEGKSAKKAVKTEKTDNAKKEAEAKKAQAAKKDKEKIEQKKTQFLEDMREILGDDKAEISDKVQIDKNGCKIRIEGKDYFGKDYASLAKAIEKAGYSPAKYLKKQALQAVA